MTAWSGDLFATHFNREKRLFCALRTIFKNFSVFPHSFWLFIVLSIHLSHKLTMFSLKNPPFSSSSLLQTSRKGMGFLFFSKYFMSIAFDVLIFEFLLRFENMMFKYGLGNFCWVCYMGFVDIDNMMLDIHVLMIASHFLVWYLIWVMLCISYPW